MVVRIESDPFRSAPIAFIVYRNGIAAYILQPEGVGIGHILENGLKCELSQGSALPLRYIPLGTMVHAIELSFGHGGCLVRGAGTFGKVLNKNLNYTLVRLSSGEERFVLASCIAIIGRVAGLDHREKSLATAGRARRLGQRPRNRPSARNPVDHPLGGRTKGGKTPVSASG
jgi:large subunit ribosomal protein L2